MYMKYINKININIYVIILIIILLIIIYHIFMNQNNKETFIPYINKKTRPYIRKYKYLLKDYYNIYVKKIVLFLKKKSIIK